MRALSPMGWVFLVITNIVLPLAAIQSGSRLRRRAGVPSRSQLLVSIFVSQAITLALSLMTAYFEHIALFPAPRWGWSNLGMAMAFLVPALGTLPMRWGWRSEEGKRRMLWRIPNRASDLRWWALVALGAGIGEEILFRGVMFQLWMRTIGSWWAVTTLCSVMFALAHFHAGLRSMVIIGLMAIGTHLIVRASGNLYTAMAIHFVYDLLAGMAFLYLARREGLLPAQDRASTRPAGVSRGSS